MDLLLRMREGKNSVERQTPGLSGLGRGGITEETGTTKMSQSWGAVIEKKALGQ